MEEIRILVEFKEMVHSIKSYERSISVLIGVQILMAFLSIVFLFSIIPKVGYLDKVLQSVHKSQEELENHIQVPESEHLE